MASTARDSRLEETALADLSVHHLWKAIHESIDQEGTTTVLRVELQDETFPIGSSWVLEEIPWEVRDWGGARGDVYCIAVPCGAFVLACGLVARNCDALRYLCRAVHARRWVSPAARRYEAPEGLPEPFAENFRMMMEAQRRHDRGGDDRGPNKFRGRSPFDP